jgi:tripartite-type tricarboxylate transporter receptor subunit TctC
MQGTIGLGLAAALVWCMPAQAQSVAEFYHGRSVQFMIGYTPGGGYDLRARLVARHLSKHLPGNPTVIPQNVPGAAGLRLANQLYNAAPKDGATMGMLARNAPTAPLLNNTGVQFDPRRFNWIGSVSDAVSVCLSTHTSQVKTFDDLLTKPFIAGAIGTVSDSVMYTRMIRNIFGAKNIKIVTGYVGSKEIAMAAERGEVEGFCGYALANLQIEYPDWRSGNQFNVLMQLSTRRSEDLPDVPLITDRARSDRDRQILNLLFSRQEIAYPIVVPPGVPRDRVDALRAAFDATMKDPDFLAEAKKLHVDLSPTSGIAMEKLIGEALDTPADVVAAAVAAVDVDEKGGR